MHDPNHDPNIFHGHKGYMAYSLLALTFIFVVGLSIYFPDFKNEYIQSYKTVWLKSTGAFSKVFNNIFSTDKTQKDLIPDPEFVSITEFGTTTEVALIVEDPNASTTASTSEDYIPTPLDEFVVSPESAWASVYLTQLGLKQEDLKLDIRYLREWQQTGGFNKDLSQGNKGADVKMMQYLLFIFDPQFKLSFVNGTFGPQTKSALARLQQKLNIKPTGIFENDTRFFFDSVFYKELCPDANPDQDKSFENVSRRVSVPLDYIPSDLLRVPRTVRSIGVMCLSKEPANRLENMFQDAAAEGHELAVFSAYRSANTQRLLTAYYLKTLGQAGLQGVAESGHSEHQLGTTVDISGKSIKYAGPSQAFGDTKEGKWLQENSYKYGFIMSYPKGRQQDTGYIYEPWHFRYVGVDIAKDIFEEGLTIQEYFNLVNGTGGENNAAGN